MVKKILISICAIILCAGCGYCIYRVYKAETAVTPPAAPEEYAITYFIDGEAVEFEVDGYTSGTSVDLPAAPAKIGHAFGGWYDNPYFSGDFITSVSASAIGDKILYAKYTPKSYIISFEGADIAEITYTFGDTLDLDPVEVDLPEVFGGYYLDEEYTEPITAISASDYGNKTIYALITTDTNYFLMPYTLNLSTTFEGVPATEQLYNRTFDYTKNYELQITTIDIASGSSEQLTVPLQNAVISEDYTAFVFSLGETYKIKITVLDDVFVVAVAWGDNPAATASDTIFIIDDIIVSNDFAVNFVGADIENLTYAYGDTVELPAADADEGYIFGGWYDNADFSGEAVTAISATDFGKKTFYAAFEEVSYTFDMTFASVNDDDIYEVILQTVLDPEAELSINSVYAYPFPVEVFGGTAEAAAMFGGEFSENALAYYYSDETGMTVCYIFIDTDSKVYMYFAFPNEEIDVYEQVFTLEAYTPVYTEPATDFSDWFLQGPTTLAGYDEPVNLVYGVEYQITLINSEDVELTMIAVCGMYDAAPGDEWFGYKTITFSAIVDGNEFKLTLIEGGEDYRHSFYSEDSFYPVAVISWGQASA